MSTDFYHFLKFSTIFQQFYLKFLQNAVFLKAYCILDVFSPFRPIPHNICDFIAQYQYISRFISLAQSEAAQVYTAATLPIPLQTHLTYIKYDCIRFHCIENVATRENLAPLPSRQTRGNNYSSNSRQCDFFMSF